MCDEDVQAISTWEPRMTIADGEMLADEGWCELRNTGYIVQLHRCKSFIGSSQIYEKNQELEVHKYAKYKEPY